MKGRSVTAEQKRFHDMLCREIGCVACALDGIFTSWVLIHHIDGRTKPNAHWLVLPLCAGHHQDGTGAPGLVAVHPWKARLEAKYGKQKDMLKYCIETLWERGLDVPGAVCVAAGVGITAQAAA